MAKILTIDGETIKALEKTQFNLEKDLQDYLERYPEIIPLEEISENPHALRCIGKEVPVRSGEKDFAIDLMYVDDEGLITIVETKLAKNPESRREVIGQIIEYASLVSKWKVSEVYEVAYSYFTRKSSEEIASLALGQFTRDGLEHSIEDNLQDGRMRLIVAIDELNEPLRATVDFLNSHSNFDILLLQVRNFKEESGRNVIVSDLFGYVTKSGTPRPLKKQWDIERFLEDASNRLSKDRLAVIQKLVDFTTKHSDGGILWGQGGVYGTFMFRKQIDGKTVTVFYVYSDGTTSINFGTLKNKGVSREILDLFRANLNSIPGFKIAENAVIEDNKSPSFPLLALASSGNFDLFKKAVLTLCQQIESGKE